MSGFAPGALSYTIWKDGVQVAALQDAGTYEIRASFATPDAHYALASTGNSFLSLTVNAAPPTTTSPATPDRPSSSTAAIIAQAARIDVPDNTALLAQAGVSGARPLAEFNPAAPNVAVRLPGIDARFGEGTALSIISSPGANEPTESVTLAQARRMVAAPGGGAAANGERDVRVPVSRNSLAEIVNGGVRLPNGVEQTLFVVKAN